MRWVDKQDGYASRLEIVDTFRSFVRPSWRPQLSTFCTALTGITQVCTIAFMLRCALNHLSQQDVDEAPIWRDVMRDFEAFLVKNGLYDSKNHRPLVKYTFCCDGPWDLSDFFMYVTHDSPEATY